MHNDQDKQISDHQEMYLKVIHGLIEENKVARVKDIADRLGVTKSSVSGALKSLSDKKLIDYDPYSFVTLTPKGERVASELLNKYRILTDFLVNVLSVPEEVAEENACRMEHVVDNFVLERLVQFLRFFERGGLTFKPKKSTRKSSSAKSANIS
jgi:DtxR family Mn-dependent transcriptional regulator